MLSPHLQPLSQQHLLHKRSGVPGWLKEGGRRRTIHPDFPALFLFSKMSHKLTLPSPKKPFTPLGASIDCWVRSRVQPCANANKEADSRWDPEVFCTQATSAKRTAGGYRGTTWHKDWSRWATESWTADGRHYTTARGKGDWVCIEVSRKVQQHWPEDRRLWDPELNH